MSVKNVSVHHAGTQIVLPIVNGKRMTEDEAIDWLKKKSTEGQRQIAVYHEIPCSPLDGAMAFHRALAHKYGWTDLAPTPGFFGDSPPCMVGVAVGVNEVVQVPWGRVVVPGIEGYLNIGVNDSKFYINGQVRNRHSDEVNEIVTLTRQMLKEQSIYKGKAVRVSFEWSREGNDFEPIKHCPQFMPLQGVAESDLIFNRETVAALDLGIFTPIELTEACRQVKVPLKRGVLLYGMYGCGKTLCAHVTALKAVRHGWTFIYLESGLDLAEGLRFASQYAPAVVFVEDIDRVTKGERSLNLDELLNVLDGVDTKGAEILAVFTTNHEEDINPAVKRFGRVDMMIPLGPPDAEAAARLVELYSRGLLETGTNLARVGEALAGNIPAFIREVVERAKIAAIRRMGNGDIIGKVLEEDLLSAAEAMRIHAQMLQPKRLKTTAIPEMLVRVPAGHASEASQRLLEAFTDNGTE